MKPKEQIRVQALRNGQVLVMTHRGTNIYDRAALLAVLLPDSTNSTEPPAGWAPIDDGIQPYVGPSGGFQGPQMEQVLPGGLYQVNHRWWDDQGGLISIERFPSDTPDKEDIDIWSADAAWLAAAITQPQA
ncbi:hypothetical protein [Arthrobacter sp.]|uniref:hypothetical protein n=1 Tax=Arthrobacter sp. TaxID=1667 RepID=UPI003A8DE7F0